MPVCLASAQRDLSEGNWRIILIWTAVLVGACLLAFIPIAIAGLRRHPHGHTILALALLWGLLTAGSVGYTINSNIRAAKEYDLRIKTGFYDPRDQTDATQSPWIFWGVLAA